MHESGEWVKEKAEAAWEEIREFSEDRIIEFKRSSKYFKWKLSIVAAYLFISILTYVIFVPAGELNQIDAEVSVRGTFLFGKHFVVANQGSEAWKDVKFTLNRSYLASLPKLPPQQKVVVKLLEFKDGKGLVPDKNLPLTFLRIECSEGAFERDFVKNPPAPTGRENR